MQKTHASNMNLSHCHHNGSEVPLTTSPTTLGVTSPSTVSMLDPVSEQLSHEATPDSLQNANSSSSSDNSSAEGKLVGYTNVMQLTDSPQAVAQPPQDLGAAVLAAAAAKQLQTVDTLCIEPSLNSWEGSVPRVPEAAEPKQPSGAAPKDAFLDEPDGAASKAGVVVDYDAHAMHKAITAVTAPPSVHMGGSCMDMQHGLDSAASPESDWVDIELFPSTSSMLQGRDYAATAFADSTRSSQWGRVAPCVAEAGPGVETNDSRTASDRPASQSNRAASLGIQAPVSTSVSTSASRYLSLAQPAFWRQQLADGSPPAAAQEASCSADAPIISKVSQHLQQLTGAARPSIAEASAAAAAKAAELKATASALTADFSAQAVERAAQLRAKLDVRLSSHQPTAAVESGQGRLGTGAVSTRLSVLQHTAGKQLAEAGARSDTKQENGLCTHDESDSIQARHGCVSLLADRPDPDKEIQKTRDGGHIAMPLSKQLMEGPVSSTTAEPKQAMQTSAQATLSAKYALADVLGFDAASVDRAEAAASMVASWWCGKKPKQSL